MQCIYLLGKCGVPDRSQRKKQQFSSGWEQPEVTWWLFNVPSLSGQSEMPCCWSVHPLTMSSQNPGYLVHRFLVGLLIFWFGGLQAAFIENTLTTTFYFHRISVHLIFKITYLVSPWPFVWCQTVWITQNITLTYTSRRMERKWILTFHVKAYHTSQSHLYKEYLLQIYLIYIHGIPSGHKDLPLWIWLLLRSVEVQR